jgi:hypothetical protein
MAEFGINLSSLIEGQLLHADPIPWMENQEAQEDHPLDLESSPNIVMWSNS